MSRGERTGIADAARLRVAPRCGARTRPDAGGHALPVAGGAWPAALPDAWMRRRQGAQIGRAARQPERLEGRVLGRRRPRPASGEARLYPGHGGECD